MCSADLLERVTAAFGALGVVGEQEAALAAWLTLTSRLSDRPLGAVVQSSSAAGKSTLADAALSLFPPEAKVAYSAMTGQALYYLGQADLAHKVLSIAEEEGASRASYPLKLLVSEGRLSIAAAGKDPATGKLVTNTYEVAGPVALLMTTTSAELDEELANRLLVLAVDEGRAQTRAVHAAQRSAETLDGLVARAKRARGGGPARQRPAPARPGGGREPPRTVAQLQRPGHPFPARQRQVPGPGAGRGPRPPAPAGAQTGHRGRESGHLHRGHRGRRGRRRTGCAPACSAPPPTSSRRPPAVSWAPWRPSWPSEGAPASPAGSCGTPPGSATAS